MLTARYMSSTKNIPAILQKIVDGTAPEKFTMAHLKGIGFKSSNDQAILPVLKDLGFLSADGTPTKRYLDYRDKSRSRLVLGEALRETYEDLFHINEHLTETDRAAIMGRFKSTHNVSDRVAEAQAATFLALLKLSELTGKGQAHIRPIVVAPTVDVVASKTEKTVQVPAFSGLRYNIEIHLPATKDVEVFNAIFKSLKEHLLDD
jgi:methyl coenzyme M reductase beta subunit